MPAELATESDIPSFEVHALAKKLEYLEVLVKKHDKMLLDRDITEAVQLQARELKIDYDTRVAKLEKELITKEKIITNDDYENTIAELRRQLAALQEKDAHSTKTIAQNNIIIRRLERMVNAAISIFGIKQQYLETHSQIYHSKETCNCDCQYCTENCRSIIEHSDGSIEVT